MAGIPGDKEAGEVVADPGSPREHRAFQVLQGRLPDLFRTVVPDPAAPRTVIVVPSLSFDAEVMAQIPGVHHYEERMLCMLLLLRLPRARLIYVTSQPLAPPIVDYYLHLLPGVPRGTPPAARAVLLPRRRACDRSRPRSWPGPAS